MTESPFLVGVTGPSCSGKGELCRGISEALNAPVLPLDAYYRPLDHLSPEQRAAVNFDDPAALDDGLLVSHVRALAGGMPIERPVYDFASHTRSPKVIPLAPAPVVLVEGLFVLHWESVRRVLSAAIFIHAPDGVCLERRLERDQRERGRTAESIVAQYETTVRPMRARYVDPALVHAGLALDGTRPVALNVRAALDYLDAALPVTTGLRAAGLPAS